MFRFRVSRNTTDLGASLSSHFGLKLPFGLFLLRRRSQSPQSRFMSTKLGLTLSHLPPFLMGRHSNDSSEAGQGHSLSVR